MELTQNPIIDREFRTNLRKWQTFYVRSAFVAGPLPPLMMVGTGSKSPLAARDAFLILSWVQLGFAAFLSPVFTAGTLCSERRKRTLGTLLLSDLSPFEIVRGMFLPRAAYLVMVILASLPVLILWILFGSITWSEILQAQIVIIGVAVLGASIGMFWSALTRGVVTALLGAYATLLLLLGAGPVLSGLLVPLGLSELLGYFPNPVQVLAELFSVEVAFGMVTGSGWRWAACSVLTLLPVVPFLMGASALLHPYRYERLRDRAREHYRRLSRLLDWPKALFPFLDKETAGRFANPIAWRELYTSAWFGFRGMVFITSVLAVLSLPVWMITFSAWKPLWLHQVVVGMELYFIGLATTVVSASSITQERETLSMDVLLTTPVRPQTVVGGKLFALTLTFWIPLALPFLHLAFFSLFGLLNPATPLIFLVLAPAVVLFYAAQGLFISTGARSLLGAQALAIVAYHSWLAVGLLGVTVMPHLWFLVLPASPFAFALQGIQAGPMVEAEQALIAVNAASAFLLFLLSMPGAVFTVMMVGKMLSVLSDRFYRFIR
ncbi:MAG: hypothetical protein ACYS47_11485 [Planctomycetota bacterium]|jgi:ABC-type transport system involved in multi-copper enzyme maturation permease subunit